MRDPPAALLYRTLISKLAKDALQFCAVGVLETEFARDFLGSYLAGTISDEGDDGVPAWKAMVVLWSHLPTHLSGALFHSLGRRHGLCRRRPGGGRDRRARLAGGL